MSSVVIDLEEYRGLIRSRDRYIQFMDALMDAAEVRIRDWSDNKPYMTIDDNDILTALKIIDKDGYEALFLKKLAEAEAEIKKADEDKEE